ncbi:YqaE/Pmp3 family membrane protein [Halovibrio variabilis]
MLRARSIPSCSRRWGSRVGWRQKTLTLFGYIPGIIYAFYVILKY